MSTVHCPDHLVRSFTAGAGAAVDAVNMRNRIIFN